jgi:hypothetical protein
MAKDALGIEERRALSAAEGGTCVSFYMPMARASRETLSNPTRMNNLMREAQIRVDQAGGGTAMLSPPASLKEDYDYWQHQEDGLAMFVTENAFRTYRLPFHMDEFLVVSDRFQLKPLVPIVVGDDRLFLLPAGVNCYLPMFAEANTYPHLVRETLPGNPEHKSAAVRTLLQAGRLWAVPKTEIPGGGTVVAQLRY